MALPPSIIKPAEFKRILTNNHSAILAHSGDTAKLRDVTYQLETKLLRMVTTGLLPSFLTSAAKIALIRYLEEIGGSIYLCSIAQYG